MASAILMLSEGEEETSFINMNDKKRVNNMFKHTLKPSIPIGSSHGWLIILDESSELYLLNPFDQSRIRLPEKTTFPHISTVEKLSWLGQEYLDVHYTNRFRAMFRAGDDILSVLSIKKVVLSTNPGTNKDFVAVVLYGDKPSIAFCRNGDKSWRRIQEFDSGSGSYHDVVCSEGSLFALGDRACVEVWDLNYMEKKAKITPPCPGKLLEASRHFPTDLFARKWYLVPCNKTGDVLFVVRYIGEFVSPDGKAIYQEAIFEGDYDHHPVICPYRTMGFHVFRLDSNTTTWEEVTSLGDCSLFLGGNHSVSLPGSDHPNIKKSAIYFTDDYWERVNEDYLYGGHDNGVFSLTDQSFEQVLDIDLQKISPPPLWIV